MDKEITELDFKSLSAATTTASATNTNMNL